MFSSFQSETGPNYYKEVPLSEILAVDTAKKLSGEVMHCFEIRTANVDFFVGEDSSSTEVSIKHVYSWPMMNGCATNFILCQVYPDLN